MVSWSIGIQQGPSSIYATSNGYTLNMLRTAGAKKLGISRRMSHPGVHPGRYIFAWTPTPNPNVGDFTNHSDNAMADQRRCYLPRSTPAISWSSNMVCVEYEGSSPFYTLPRAVPGWVIQGNISNRCENGGGNFPAKVEGPRRSADRWVGPLGTVFAQESVRWVLILSLGGCRLNTSVWSAMWALLVSVMQRTIFCACVATCSSCFPLIVDLHPWNR